MTMNKVIVIGCPGAGKSTFARTFAAARGCRFLWALEKNERALRFYERHGFTDTGERKYEDGTTEYLVKLSKD